MINKRVKLFGESIRKARKQKGYSQEAFALTVGIDRSYMGKIERGENNITLARAFEISDALNITLNELLDY